MKFEFLWPVFAHSLLLLPAIPIQAPFDHQVRIERNSTLASDGGDQSKA